MVEDIYCLAFTMCQTKEVLVNFVEQKQEETEGQSQLQTLPHDTNLNKLFMAAMFCCFCQVTISIFLLLYYLSDKTFYFVSWEMQVSRFICACLIHFQYSNKMFRAMRMMKYSCFHWNEFRYAKAAFLFALL